MLFFGKAVDTAAAFGIIHAVGAGWEKVVNGELNSAEGIAGLGVCVMVAGFLRNTKIINGD